MAEYTLLMLETSGIQDYVFGSNNLRVNVGASALVTDVTEQWVKEALPQPHNVVKQENDRVEVRDQSIEGDGLHAEAIYLGGGNALLLFRDGVQADEFVHQLSTKLLTDAPGLRVAIERMKIQWETEVLKDKLAALREQLAARKQRAHAALPLPGLGVTAACVFTGEPAVEFHQFGPKDEKPPTDVKLISASVQARLNKVEWANDTLWTLAPEVRNAKLWAVSDFEHFGTPGESSYIAIVHADGNRMGERIGVLSRDYTSPSQNRDYANRLRAFSRSAHGAARAALVETIRTLLVHRIVPQEGKPYWQSDTVQGALCDRLPKVEQRRDDRGRAVLPFRPLLFGGDDVTFVCDGRLGLALAHTYLTEYGKHKLEDGQPAVGRAGVAIVNTHFPFAQGYELAEALAKSAKQAGDKGHAASLDWHFGVNGVVQSLDTIRATAYTVPEGHLVARPLRLPATGDWRRWATFEALVTEFQTGKDWSGRRNKLKALQSAMRGGRPHVRAFLENYVQSNLPKPATLTVSGVEREGWAPEPDQQGDRCVYFDALEALDFFIPL